MMIGSFLFFLAIFVAIGVASAFVKTNNTGDYLLAGSNVPPWLVSLSAVATLNSGYMFIGLIGATYAVGIQTAWFLAGWVVGDLMASLFIHKRLRTTTEAREVLSYGGALSNWHGKEQPYLRAVIGFITLTFLGVYAAAQLSAGSKALHVLFEWDYSMGAIIGAVIVLAYCFAGGIRASIWTDAAQSFVMIIAMSLMLYMTVNASGGFDGFWGRLQNVSPDYMAIFPPDLKFGIALFLASWVFAGLGVIGQPHIMVRFMTMASPKDMTRVRIYYYSWYSAFCVLSVLVGLAARLLIPIDDGSFDAELALPTLATELLPPVLVGLVMAGLFAATMSTADSQILSCTAAVTRDLSFGRKPGYWTTKLATVGITALALLIALFASENVFNLVLIAWSALGAAFGPLLILYCLGQKPNQWLAIVMIMGGVAVIPLWRYLGYTDSIYEIMPGMLAGFVIFLLGKMLGFKVKHSHEEKPK
ncbi:MAG: sodium:proline symporter [Micavibrio sp.]|nr:sodium:proline symporter [Micavibrio sp.]|tara:strand:- start:997 stop:2418 length:1422 start_codon:yes stop_codon:yes gene_type:complete